MEFLPSREVVLTIGYISIHWYGVMYLAAFLIAWWLLPVLLREKGISLTGEERSHILTSAIIGTIIGGRLGYVVFYGTEYFLHHPLEIFAIWNGGMSSHGGILGVAITLILAHIKFLKTKLTIWQLADIVVIPAAIGLAFGRMGNFINQELYGPLTTLPWGMHFDGAEGLRHPTQIYAVIKDLLIAALCMLNFSRVRKEGTTFGLFLVLYGVLRFFIEFIRIETADGWQTISLYLTRGQVLTIPVLIAGILVLIIRHRRTEAILAA